jgi:hypothetical protein
MQTFKNIFYYIGWSIFWVAILVGAIWFSVETKMIRFTAPILFLFFIGYAFYAMLKTKPSPPIQEPPETLKEWAGASSREQSPTPDTKSDAGTQSSK